MELRQNYLNNAWLFGALVIIFGMAFLRVHMRVQTTLIGYEIGRLKNVELDMLEERSQLQMQLAKLTTKQHLSLMVTTKDRVAPHESLAVQ